MLNRFDHLHMAVLNDQTAQFLFSTLPAKKLAACFVLYEKRPFEDVCRYSVYSVCHAPGSTTPDVDVELFKHRVWLEITSEQDKLSIYAIPGILPDYRTPISVDLNNPLLMWVSKEIPDIYGFN